MNLFWTVLILVPVSLVLVLSGLFIVGMLVVAIVGGVDALATAMRHRRRPITRTVTGARPAQFGTPALHH